jgi:hypothetical protein
MDLNELTIKELRDYADKNGISIPSSVTRKADIVAFLENPPAPDADEAAKDEAEAGDEPAEEPAETEEEPEGDDVEDDAERPEPIHGEPQPVDWMSTQIGPDGRRVPIGQVNRASRARRRHVR